MVDVVTVVVGVDVAVGGLAWRGCSVVTGSCGCGWIRKLSPGNEGGMTDYSLVELWRALINELLPSSSRPSIVTARDPS